MRDAGRPRSCGRSVLNAATSTLLVGVTRKSDGTERAGGSSRRANHASEVKDGPIDENGGAKLDHRAANRSCFWAE